MAVLSKGQTFATGDQVTALKLNDLVDDATFAAGAVDNASTQLSGGAIIVKDDGVTTAKINDGAVTTAKIVDANVTKAKIENLSDYTVLGNVSGGAAAPAEVSILDEDDMVSDSDTAIATQQSIKAYVDGLPNFSPLSYAGEESVTLPNGLIMKFGRVSKTTNGNHTVTFATPFPNSIVSVNAISNTTQPETISVMITGTPSLTTMIVGIFDEQHLSGFFWQAIGY
jgi:hypothetical protein